MICTLENNVVWKLFPLMMGLAVFYPCDKIPHITTTNVSSTMS